MNATHIAALVDEGMQLHIEIATRERRLKEIDDALKDLAVGHPKEHVPLKDKEREGTRFLARGTHVVLPIVCTADSIRQTFLDRDPALPAIQDLAGDSFKFFYRRIVSYNAVHVKSNKFDGKAFRYEARKMLPDPERFIRGCLRVDKTGAPASTVRVSWDDLDRITPPL